MKDDQLLHDRIKELGGDEGFWKGGTEERLFKLANHLVNAYSVPSFIAAQVVEDVWVLAKEEYGE